MIYTREQWSDSGLIKKTVYDTVAQTVTITEPPAAPVTRPMSPEETADLAAREDADTAVINTNDMVDDSSTSVDKLVATIEKLNSITSITNTIINQNPATVIKDLTRECKTIARQLNREARLTSGRTESTDTGPVTDV